MMNAIENAYLAVEVKAKPIEPIRQCFMEHLRKTGYQAEKPDRSVHVSLCYCLGSCSEEKLEKLGREIANQKIELRVTGVELLRGQTTPYDYITLTLEKSESFARAKMRTDEELLVRNFEGEFKIHVSLLRVPEGSLDDVDFESLNHQLSELAQPFCWQTLISGESVSVFDKTHTCRFQFRISDAA